MHQAQDSVLCPLVTEISLNQSSCKNTISNQPFGRHYKFHYCANEILNCSPALVLVLGALEEIYGVTLRWSK